MIAAAKRSGRSVTARPIVMPPALPPWPASFFGDVQPSLTSHSAQAMKSFHVFGLFAFCPARCYSCPFSPPPRTWAMAITPPFSSQASRVGL